MQRGGRLAQANAAGADSANVVVPAALAPKPSPRDLTVGPGGRIARRSRIGLGGERGEVEGDERHEEVTDDPMGGVSRGDFELGWGFVHGAVRIAPIGSVSKERPAANPLK